MLLRDRSVMSHLRKLFGGASSARKEVRATARSRIAAAARYVVENLEERALLTTLVGGDTLIFINEDNHYQAIRAYGNITAEIIGANVQSDNTVSLINLAGELNGVPVNGGFGLAPGATPVGTVTISNPGGPAITTVPANLSLDPTNGQMYGIVIQTIPPVPPALNATNAAYLVQVDPTTGTGTVVANISPEILSAAGVAPMSPNYSVTSAPLGTFGNNGQYYFSASAGVGGPPQYFTVNPANPTGSVQGIPGNFGGNTPTAITTDAGGNLVAFAGNNLITANPNNTNQISSNIPIKGINGTVTGIAFQNGNLYAITPTNVYLVDPASGTAVDQGPLPNGNVGKNPGGLSFDPFNNTLISVDTSAHQLFTVTIGNRVRSQSIFQIYISQSDPTGQIQTAILSSQPPMPVQPSVWVPYSPGLQGGLYVMNAQSGVLFYVTPPGGSGDALIGARNRFTDTLLTTVEGIPITTGIVTGTFAQAPYATGTQITSGIVSAPGTTINKIMIGGPVLGNVDLQGNIDTFYAGWLITGDANGTILSDVTSPGNFTVSGDIRNLISNGTIGSEADVSITKPDYVTGFDMHVGGTVGWVRTFGSIVGNVVSDHSPAAQNLTTDQSKLQTYTGGIPDPWGAGIFGGLAGLNSETFASAQMLGTIPVTVNGPGSAIVVNGILQADAANNNLVDYYGVALLAGQTITVKLTTTPIEPLDVAVFNPDGTQIATDYSAADLTQTQQQPFRVTADRPGVYRFAVAETGDAFFTGNPNPIIRADFPYNLTVQGVGDLAVGAVQASANILDDPSGLTPQPSFAATSGDFGALTAGQTIASINPYGQTISVNAGNLRDVDAGSIGVGTNNDPEIQVPVGSVGLVSTTAGQLFFNYGANPPAIGKDYQVVSSAGDLTAELIANGNIGVLRAASIANNVSIFHVNAANNPTITGSIDLIDVTGDLGSAIFGGPHIITGPQGNVGFIRVGGNVYRDATFGGSQPEETIYQPGESVTLTDDSGATVLIQPTAVTPSTTTIGTGSGATTGTGGGTTGTGTSGGSTSTGGTPGLDPNLGQLTIIAYGIEGSGGVAIISINATEGLTVTGSGNVPGQTVQIGKITVGGAGAGLVTITPNTKTQPAAPGTTTTTTTGGSTTTVTGTGVVTNNTPGFTLPGLRGVTLPLPNPVALDPAATANLSLILQGSARMDVFEVDGGAFNAITDNTGGDVVNLTATSVGAVNITGSLGSTQGHTPAAVNGQAVVANAYPFVNDHNLVTIGSVATLAVGKGIGNVQVNGELSDLVGSINGPVEVNGSIYQATLGGQGILPSGSGANSDGGLYVTGQIGYINNSQGGDVRGPIVSQTGITSVDLHNGSIINTVVGVLTAFNMAVQLPVFTATPANGTPITDPTLEVGTIETTGSGGIIGTVIHGQHIGIIAVRDGFGIFDTLIPALGDSTIEALSASGYGLRAVTWAGGSRIGRIAATGDGSNIPVTHYSPGVRVSETNTFDPYFGFQPNRLTDIDVYTGASLANPSVPGGDGFGTDTGVMEDVTFEGNRNLGSVTAHTIRATAPALAPSILNFANTISYLSTASVIDGLSVITGRVVRFAPGGDVMHLTVQIAGPIRQLQFNGNVLASSTISASGINGNIGTLKIKGTLEGSITASRKINSVTIYGNLTGTISALNVNNIKLYGYLNGGNLDIQGSVGTFQTLGNLGLPGETLTLHGSAKLIKIGGNVNANIHVEGTLGTLYVGGSVLSGNTVVIDDGLGVLQINGDVQAGSSITAASIKKRKIKGVISGVIT